MTLADKIISLRKQKGWSQEELAEKLDVTRQSVSKWESAQSVPDIAKILQISELFGVTTDYLLKDNEEAAEYAEDAASSTAEETENKDTARAVNMKEAEEYLAVSRASAGKMALATLLCIVSPIALLLLMGAVGAGYISVALENICVLIGIIVLLFIVGTAVIVFICLGSDLSKYDYIEKEAVKLDVESRKKIEAEREAFRAEYTKRNAIGVALCILGAISTLIGAFTEHEMLVMIGISGTLLLVALGVYSFVTVGVPWGAMQKMLEEGDFTRCAKKTENIMEHIGAIYWPIITIIYLGYSFATFKWHISWVIWPVAAVVFGVIEEIFKVKDKNEKDK